MSLATASPSEWSVAATCEDVGARPPESAVVSPSQAAPQSSTSAPEQHVGSACLGASTSATCNGVSTFAMDSSAAPVAPATAPAASCEVLSVSDSSRCADSLKEQQLLEADIPQELRGRREDLRAQSFFLIV